jgi:D-lactate dehydrogenase (cytochrome)
MAETQADIAGAPFFISVVGHVGDGNFHLGLVAYPANAAELAEAESLNDRLVRRVMALDGACPGERSVRAGHTSPTPGYGRGLGVMQAIKTALDPLGILNPGNRWR